MILQKVLFKIALTRMSLALITHCPICCQRLFHLFCHTSFGLIMVVYSPNCLAIWSLALMPKTRAFSNHASLVLGPGVQLAPTTIKIY